MNYIFTPTNTQTLRAVSRCVNEVQLFYYCCFLFALLHLTSSFLINDLLLLSFLFSFHLLRGSICHFLLFLRLFLVSFYGHTFVSQQVKLSRSKVTVCKHTDIDTRWEPHSVCWVCICGWVLFLETNPCKPKPCLSFSQRTSEDERVITFLSLSLTLFSSVLLSAQIKRQWVRVG